MTDNKDLEAMAKVVITQDVEVRHPKRNAALSLKADKKEQSLPRWAVDAAVKVGRGEEPGTKKAPAEK